MTPEMRALKGRLKTVWESGDYGVFARYLEKGALDFLDRLDLAPGSRLLDVACGTGQLAIPAATRGVRATGLDLAANLVRQARSRAADAGLLVPFDEGDAENLPYTDASFDVVVSLIGAMFAPRPDVVAAEMIRVCKPGGRIVMGNWTAEGHVGEMFAVIAKYVAPPPVPSPLLWGDASICRQRFGDGVQTLAITRHLYPFEYPYGPASVVDFFADYYGPVNRAFLSLDESGRKALHADLTALWTLNNRSANGTLVYAEYIQVDAIRNQAPPPTSTGFAL